jgi:uridine kinase
MNQISELARVISAQISEHDGSPILVAICGAADLGKTHLSMQLVNELVKTGISAGHLTLDSYLMDRTHRTALGISGYQPEAYDLPMIKSDLLVFLSGSSIEYFPYDHAKGKVLSLAVTISSCQVLFVDGLHSLHENLKPHINYSVFICTNDDLLLKIRHRADIEKRRQSIEFSKLNLNKEISAYKLYVEPYMCSADVVYELKEQWQYELKSTAIQT